MQLRENKSVSDQFVFRLGELHIVFFIESGIYGSTTMAKIIGGKHME